MLCLTIYLATLLPSHVHILESEVLEEAAHTLNAVVILAGKEVHMRFDPRDEDCHFATFAVEQFHSDLLDAGYDVELVTVA